MAKEILIKFKLNGVDRSIKDIETLNQKVGNLQDTFVDTSKEGKTIGENLEKGLDQAEIATGGIASGLNTIEGELKDVSTGFDTTSSTAVDSLSTTGEAVNQTADNVTNITNNFSDAGDSVSDFSDTASSSLDDVNSKVKDVGDNISHTGKRGEQFGRGLEKSTKVAASAVGGLASGLEAVGVQSESLNQLSNGFRTIAELMKIQELLGIRAFGSKSIIDQMKALGALTKVQKANVVLTEAQTGAQTANAVATTGASTAVKGLNTVMAASPWGATLIAIGLVVAAIQLFSSSTKSSIKDIENQIDAFKELDVFQSRIRENFIASAKNDLSLQTDQTQKQLDLLQLQNGSITQQEVLQKRLIEIKKKSLELELTDLKSEQRANAITIIDTLRAVKRLEEDAKKISGEDLTKNIELQKKLNTDIETIQDKQKKNVIEQNEVNNKILVTDTFDLKILQEQTEEKRKQLQIQRLEFEESIKNSKIENQDTINEVTFEVDNAKLETDLEYAKGLLDRFNNSRATEKIDFFGVDVDSFQKALDVSIDVINKSTEQELNVIRQTEKEKQEEYSRTAKEKISEIEKTIRFENKSAQEIKLLQSQIANEISTQSQLNSKNYENSLNERVSSIEKFNQKVIESTNVTEEQLQNILNSSTEDEQLNSFIENEKIRTQTVVTGIQSQIEVNNDLLNSTTLTNEKRKNIEKENVKLIEDSSKIQTTSLENIDKAQSTYFSNLLVNIRKVSQENSKLSFSQELASEVDSELKKVTKSYDENYKSIERSQDEFNEALQEGNIIRIGFSLKEINELRKNAKVYGEVAIEEAEKVKTKLTEKLNEKANQDKASGLFDEKQYNDDLKNINNAYDEVVDGVDDNNKRLIQSFRNAAGEITSQIGMIADSALSLAQALTDLSAQKTENQINEIEEGFELMSEQFDEETDLRQEHLDNELEQIQEQQNEKLDIISQSQSAIERLEGQLNGARGNRHKFLLQLIDTERKRKLQAQIESAKLAEQEKTIQEQKLAEEKARAEERVRLEEEKEAKIEALRKRQFEKQKKLDKASAIIKGALAVITTLATAPYPASIALAALQAIAVAVEVDTINATEYEEGGELEHDYLMVDSKGKLINYRAKGGQVEGPSHKEGGVRGTGRFNNVEVEGGEFIVRKDAVQKGDNKKAIETINNNPDKEFVVVEKSIAEKSNINSKESRFDSKSNKESNSDVMSNSNIGTSSNLNTVNNSTSQEKNIERQKENEFMSATKTILRQYGGEIYSNSSNYNSTLNTSSNLFKYDLGGSIATPPQAELIPAASSFNRAMQEVSLQPNFELFESTLANNTGIDTQSISQAVLDGLAQANISVAVVDINAGQERVAKVLSFTRTGK